MAASCCRSPVKTKSRNSTRKASACGRQRRTGQPRRLACRTVIRWSPAATPSWWSSSTAREKKSGAIRAAAILGALTADRRDDSCQEEDHENTKDEKAKKTRASFGLSC